MYLLLIFYTRFFSIAFTKLLSVLIFLKVYSDDGDDIDILRKQLDCMLVFYLKRGTIVVDMADLRIC